jgi:hypothetical protein
VGFSGMGPSWMKGHQNADFSDEKTVSEDGVAEK